MCIRDRSLTSVIGEDELSAVDKKYMEFGRLFERYFINQGFNTNRSIEELSLIHILRLSTMRVDHLYLINLEKIIIMFGAVI